MAIGRLRWRVTLEARVVGVKDPLGGDSETWLALAETWAEITPLSGSQGASSGAELSQATTAIRIRYRAGLPLTLRVRQGARTWLVDSWQDPDGRRHELLLLCHERPAPAATP